MRSAQTLAREVARQHAFKHFWADLHVDNERPDSQQGSYSQQNGAQGCRQGSNGTIHTVANVKQHSQGHHLQKERQPYVGWMCCTWLPHTVSRTATPVSLPIKGPACVAVFHLPRLFTATALWASPPKAAAHSLNALMVISLPIIAAISRAIDSLNSREQFLSPGTKNEQ